MQGIEEISCYDKRFEDLTLADDFMFKLVLENPAICKTLIELVIARRVERIVSLETEKTLNINFFSHSVRFDVYVEGGGEVIDFEMQRGYEADIARRARSYQSEIDASLMQKGKPYSSLKETWIVFFCTFDPFSLHIPVYKVSQVFEGTQGQKYDDGAHKVFYNASAWEACEDVQMRAFLKLIMGKASETEFTHALVDEMKQLVKRQDIRSAFMGVQEIIDRKVERMLNSKVEKSKDVWLAQNKDIWLQQGTHEKALQTARRALERGFAPDVAADLTGLTLEEVLALR